MVVSVLMDEGNLKLAYIDKDGELDVAAADKFVMHRRPVTEDPGIPEPPEE